MKKMFLGLVFIFIASTITVFAASARETVTLSDSNWTLVAVDPDSNGYVRFTIDQINANRYGTYWSPINTATLPTSLLKQGEQTFYRNIYVKNVNANVSNPVYLSITRDGNYTNTDTYTHDGYGNKIASYGGALNVHDPHSHNVIINEQFHQHTATTTTFNANARAGDVNITLASITGFAVGNYLHLEDGVIEDNHPQITVLTGNIATLDRPLDNNFSIGDTITKTIQSMNVSGTLSSPQSFTINPPSDQTWHIEYIFFEMTHATAGDNGLFGNIAALTNGFVIRVYDGSTGKFKTLSNWKTNSGMVLDGYDVTYAARSGGSGAYGTNAKGSIYQNSGAVIRLNGTTGDYIQILVQDNLSTDLSFRGRVQAHIEGQ